jgi:hypothetical protein
VFTSLLGLVIVSHLSPKGSGRFSSGAGARNIGSTRLRYAYRPCSFLKNQEGEAPTEKFIEEVKRKRYNLDSLQKFKCNGLGSTTPMPGTDSANSR